MLLRPELEAAVTIAREAGRVLLEIYAGEFRVDFKGQGTSDPVTEADRRANTLIVERLRARFPDDGIVAEESDDNDLALRKSRIWYVDPLDGTKEFVAKNGEFSVMIGLSIEGRAELGVVLQPSCDKLYRGVLGQGATLEHAGRVQPLTVSELAMPGELCLILSRSHRPKSADALMKRLGISKEATSGSVGLKIGQIAERHADLYVHVSDKSSAWDTCAPEAILHAAGGRFTQLSGEPFRYGQRDLRTRGGILACNAAAYAAVLPHVREIAKSEGFVAA